MYFLEYFGFFFGIFRYILVYFGIKTYRNLGVAIDNMTEPWQII